MDLPRIADVCPNILVSVRVYTADCCMGRVDGMESCFHPDTRPISGVQQIPWSDSRYNLLL